MHDSVLNKEKVSTEKKDKEPDSDSSSLPSLEEEQNSKTENKQDNKKKNTVKKEESTRGQKVSLCVMFIIYNQNNPSVAGWTFMQQVSVVSFTIFADLQLTTEF